MATATMFASLTLIAQALRSSAGEQNVLARVGGEEFAAILLGAREAETLAAAERMRRAVESIPWMTINGQKTRLTVSIGGALGRPELKGRDVLKEADRQLYNAKRLGRNRVSTAAAEWSPAAPQVA